jgi:hypothetical protein
MSKIVVLIALIYTCFDVRIYNSDKWSWKIWLNAAKRMISSEFEIKNWSVYIGLNLQAVAPLQVWNH